MIVFKVVEKRTRFGTNWAICKSEHGHLKNPFKKLLRFKKANPEFFPRYFKGKLIKRAEGTVGILTFKREIDAERFINSLFAFTNDITKIIRVKGIGTPTVQPMLIGRCGSSPERLLYTPTTFDQILPPIGTLAFPMVRVLE